MALTVTIKVVPASGSLRWELDKQGTLKCYLKSQPEHGAANKELLRSIARLTQTPLEHVEIITGLTSRKKVIRIHKALTLEELLNCLGIEAVQCKLTK